MDKFFLTAAAGLGAFFGFGGDHKIPPPERNSIQIHASSTSGSIDIACIAAAVAARESALGSAASANAQALTSAYTDRAAALASAYTQTGNDAIRKAVKSAWDRFGAALRLAQRGWRGAQQTAWTNFKTAVKACGPSAAAVTDATHASADVGAGAGSD